MSRRADGRAFSSVGLERLLDMQEVGSSSLPTPINITHMKSMT